MEKEYLYWLEKEAKFIFGAPEARSISVWAKSPIEGLTKLLSYKDRGYQVKYLYPLEEFREKRHLELIAEEKLKTEEKKREAHKAKIEVENV